MGLESLAKKAPPNGRAITSVKWHQRLNPISGWDNDVDFSIDRTTGRLNIDGRKANCRVVEQKRLF